MKKLFAATAIFTTFCGTSFAMGVFSSSDADVPSVGMTPGGVQKKYVGLLFDVLNTSPSNVLANADQFAERAPYLDGVALALQDVPVIDSDGSVVTSKHWNIMHPTHRWTRDAIKDQIPILQAISKKPNLTDCFLLFWQTPGDRKNRLDWTDDKAWANYTENMANVAWLAKEGGMKGLMLDPEEYKLAPQYIHTDRDPPFEECAKLARARGRQVFSRVFKEFPDAVIWSLWFFHRFSYWMEHGRQQYPAIYCDDAAELSWHYYNGMIDVMPPTARAVDGAEHYSGSSLENAYIYDFVNQASGALAFIAPENIAKFRSQFLFSNTHYLDMYTLSGNPKSRWYHGPVKGSRLEHMRLNFEQSLRVATEYIWIYGENSGKLFNWRDGHYAKQKTWEEISPGMTETIMMVKDPTGLAERRKAELRKKGELKNLLADVEPFEFVNPGVEREFVAPASRNPIVTGIKAGERYTFSVAVNLSSMKEDPLRYTAACPRVVWLKNGEVMDEKPVPLTFADDMSASWSDFRMCYATATVPKGADALHFIFAVKLRCGERARFRDMKVRNNLDPLDPPKAVKAGKWIYDEKSKTLSDGNWTLEAKREKDSLVVSGKNEKTIGNGVLDLTNVKADTGLTVKKLGSLRNIAALTGVVAPDVVQLLNGPMSGSSNIVHLVLGNIRLPGWAKSSAAKRYALIVAAGLKPDVKLSPSGEVQLMHSRAPVMRPEKEICVKGVKPGELYSLGFSMKRRGAGWMYGYCRFRKDGKNVYARVPAFAMRQPRKDDVWRSTEIVVRVPEGVDEIYFDISAEVNPKIGYYGFKDFKAYKIGGPLPVWPAESVREKEYGRK